MSRGDGKDLAEKKSFQEAEAIFRAGVAAVDPEELVKSALNLSGGTDGIDAHTPAAGAICDGTTQARGKQLGLAAGDFLERNDSYTYFQALEDLLITGPPVPTSWTYGLFWWSNNKLQEITD